MTDTDHATDLAVPDPAAFWRDAEYAHDTYRSDPFTDELRATVEAQLGFRLPRAYVAMMRSQNGGMPRNTCCPAPTATSWAPDHIAISGIMGIGRLKPQSLCGSAGSRFWCDEWNYPPIGVYFADCPSAGYDMVAMDYTDCGPRGEPRIVHVDQELDYRVTVLSSSFVHFVRSLCPETIYRVD